MTMPLSSQRAGFTLIELVVVLAVIALLLTIALPRYFNSIDQGKFKVQQQNIASMRDAIDKFYGDQGRYPETLDELVTRRYLRTVPLDPVTEKSDWLAIAPNSESGQTGVYDVRSAAPLGPSEREGAPAILFGSGANDAQK